MKGREFQAIGIPRGPALKAAAQAVGRLAGQGLRKKEMKKRLAAVVAEPGAFADDPVFAELAAQLLCADPVFEPREEPAPWKQWGRDLDENAVQQMRNACDLPVAVAGALMPDAHHGYGLPIGGVLATRGAVIPYAVGVDIACRMKLTVFDIPPDRLGKKKDKLASALEEETRFGMGAKFEKGNRRQHEVLDEDWTITEITKRMHGRAFQQLGTSGSGNHFVEFGELTLPDPDLGLEAGNYLALLSHSGSRGPGANVANHYSKLAMAQHPELPHQLKHLAWLDLDSADGQEYWAAMELMGRFAEACHACIHRSVAKHLGAQVILDVENHHNFAWKEEHGGEELIVHRKGATPAGAGVLGIIPGSMAAPGFLVRGKGNADSLRSASHGAGRVMSRRAAKNKYRWAEVREFLKQRNVTLLSADIDECPMAYKDIRVVMNEQDDLVERVARFDPRLVKMAPPDEDRGRG